MTGTGGLTIRRSAEFVAYLSYGGMGAVQGAKGVGLFGPGRAGRGDGMLREVTGG